MRKGAFFSTDSFLHLVGSKAYVMHRNKSEFLLRRQFTASCHVEAKAYVMQHNEKVKFFFVPTVQFAASCRV